MKETGNMQRFKSMPVRRRSTLKRAAVRLVVGIGLTVSLMQTRCLAQVSQHGATAERPDLAKIFQSGQLALKEGDLDEAEADFRKVLRRDPRSAAAYVNLGVIEMRRKHWDQALTELHRAEHLAPKMTGVRLNIGLVEYHRANYVPAIASLQAVVAEQPDSVQARYLLGLCYSLVEKYPDAVQALEPLWPQMSSQFPYLYVLANSAFHSGNDVLDQKASQRLVEVGGDAPEFHLLLAKSMLNRDENQRALEELQKAKQSNPALPFLHFNFGVAYQRLGQLDQAESEFRADIAAAPDLPYSYERLGLIYLRAGKDQQSQESFQQALQREARLPTSLIELAKLQLGGGDTKAALEYSASAVRLVPENKNAHFVYGQVLQKLGRRQEAAREFELTRKLSAAGVDKDRASFGQEKVPEPELAQQP
jgi:tetratricopeptide (TPR) repeat protein